jgi:phage terminase small subunit
MAAIETTSNDNARPLNPKQRRFALEYLECLNATQAAKAAGYSARTAKSQGSRLLTNADVREFVEVRLKKAEAKAELTVERLELELARVAFLDPAAAYDEEGRLLPLADMPEDARRAIAGFEEEALFDNVEVPDDEGTKKVRTEVGVVRKVKWLPKVEAIALGLKRRGALVDKSEVVVHASPDPTDEELEELARLRHQVRGKGG